MNLHRFLIAVMGATVGLCGVASQADALLASVKTFGMAAAGVAYPLDAFAGAFNPAGQAEIGDRVDVGITWIREHGHTTVSGNTIDSNPFISALVGGKVNGRYNGFRTPNTYAPEFAANKRLGCECEWALGLVVFNRNYSKTTYNRPFLLLGTTNGGLEYLHETIAPVIAYKWNDCHNFGISINYMVQRLKVNGIQKLDKNPSALSPIGSIAPGHVTNKGYDYSTGWGFTLGWQWHITDCVTFGLTYQPETSMKRFKKYKGFIAHKGRLNIPEMYSAGLAWTFCNDITVAFDVQHYNWGQIHSLHNPLLHNGRIELLGSRHGPGFGFRNQTFYRLGINWQATEDWSLRCGYRYGNSPIRRSQTVVNQLTLDTVENYVTVGTTYAINPCNELSAFFAYGFQKKIKGHHSIPPGIPLALPGAQFGFGGGEADLVEQKIALGISWGWNY